MVTKYLKQKNNSTRKTLDMRVS